MRSNPDKNRSRIRKGSGVLQDVSNVPGLTQLLFARELVSWLGQSEGDA